MSKYIEIRDVKVKLDSYRTHFNEVN